MASSENSRINFANQVVESSFSHGVRNSPTATHKYNSITSHTFSAGLIRY